MELRKGCTFNADGYDHNDEPEIWKYKKCENSYFSPWVKVAFSVIRITTSLSTFLVHLDKSAAMIICNISSSCGSTGVCYSL